MVLLWVGETRDVGPDAEVPGSCCTDTFRMFRLTGLRLGLPVSPECMHAVSLFALVVLPWVTPALGAALPEVSLRVLAMELSFSWGLSCAPKLVIQRSLKKLIFIFFSDYLHSILLCVGVGYSIVAETTTFFPKCPPRYFQSPPGTVHGYYILLTASPVPNCTSLRLTVLWPPICTSQSLHLFLLVPPHPSPLATISLLSVSVSFIVLFVYIVL